MSGKDIPHKTSNRLAPALGVYCAFAFAAAEAVTVHTWVDADGVTHFSDQAPATEMPAEVFDIAVTQPTDAAADYYSIANQWARLRAERDAADARALVRQRLRTEAAAAAAPPAVEVIREGAVVGPFGFGGYGGFRSPHHRHGRRAPFPVDRKGYLDSRRGVDFIPAPVPAWPRQR
ncbi:MAG: DUF4124 domain-containing protein [Gammaproteobacteria bacterium]